MVPLTTLSRPHAVALVLATLVLPLAAGSPLSAAKQAAGGAPRFTDQFNLSGCQWASTGSSDYFILEPGHQDVFTGVEEGDPTVLEITVLEETRAVAGVETRVVEERETRRGVLVEVSRNYFALCGPGNDAFYFGEDVDMYEGGKVKNHEGSWIAGQNGARQGLFMPARPLLGARFYQEIATGVAMDRVEIVSDNELMKTTGGNFENCVKTEETTPLEPDARETKAYARGVGLVQDGDLLLSRHGAVSPSGR